MKITKKEIVAEVEKMESKYSDLVWLARSSSEHDHIEGVIDCRKRIASLYPEDTIRLLEDDSTNWNHGFNSGMLAGMRYILDLVYEGKEDAEDSFPFLDT